MHYTCMEHPAALQGSAVPRNAEEALLMAQKEVKEKLLGHFDCSNVADIGWEATGMGKTSASTCHELSA